MFLCLRKSLVPESATHHVGYGEADKRLTWGHRSGAWKYIFYVG